MVKNIYCLSLFILILLLLTGYSYGETSFDVYYKIQFIPEYNSEGIDTALDKICMIIRNKLEEENAKDVSVTIENKYIIIKAKTISAPSKLEYFLNGSGGLVLSHVDDLYTEKARGWVIDKYPSYSLESLSLPEILAIETKIAKAINLPKHLVIRFLYGYDKSKQKVVPQHPVAIHKNPSLTGSDIKEAYSEKNEYGNLVISFRTTIEGANKFAEATSAGHIGERLAIVIGNKIRSAPVIREQIASGRGNISGNFSTSEIDDIVFCLNNGSLPYSVFISEKSVKKIENSR